MILNTIILNKLGRYEYTKNGSNKFWQIKFLDIDKYEVSWGAIQYRNSGLNKNIINETEVYKKVAEKIRKGYKKVAYEPIDSYHFKLNLESEIEKKTIDPQAKKYKI